MTGTATATKPAPAAHGNKPVPARPFRVGVKSTDEIDYDDTRNLGAATIDLPVLQIPATGFLRHLYVLVEATTAGNAASVTFAEDGPFNVFDSIALEDVNSQPVVGPFTGWDLAIINKLGGYSFSDDPRASLAYSVTTGSGATGGSFSFVLRVPVELVPRDGLGALPNKSGNSMFKLRMRYAASATVYGTAPTSAPSMHTRVQPVSWWDPDATDLKGRPLSQNPPAVTTTQFWSKSEFTLAAGNFRQQLERVGYLVRNIIPILRDSTGSRAQGEADWPDPMTLKIEANQTVNRIRKVWQHMIAEAYGYTASIGDAKGGKDNGVYVFPFNDDFGPKPGWETRRGYLATSSAARIELAGSIGGTGVHKLAVLTNDVSPAGGDDAALTV